MQAHRRDTVGVRPGQRDALGRTVAGVRVGLGEVAARRIVGPGRRDDAVDEHVGTFQRCELAAQP